MKFLTQPQILKYNATISNYTPTSKSNPSRQKSMTSINLTLTGVGYKHHWIKKQNTVARSKLGRLLIRSKGQIKKIIKLPRFNYNLRDNNLMFIGSIVFVPRALKYASIIIFATGASSVVPTTNNHKMFLILGNPKPSNYEYRFVQSWIIMNSSWAFSKFIKTLVDLPKNKPVCLLEQFYNSGVQYVRASGSKARIKKLDSRVSMAVIQLPSKSYKVFDAFSLGSEGQVELISKQYMLNNSAGSQRHLGRKSVVRGVAMNPVDHPHGGRAKSVKHQRTPWGSTAKKTRRSKIL